MGSSSKSVGSFPELASMSSCFSSSSESLSKTSDRERGLPFSSSFLPSVSDTVPFCMVFALWLRVADPGLDGSSRENDLETWRGRGRCPSDLRVVEDDMNLAGKERSMLSATLCIKARGERNIYFATSAFRLTHKLVLS